MTRLFLAASLLCLLACADHRDARPALPAVGDAPAPGSAPASPGAPAPEVGALLHAGDSGAPPVGAALAFVAEGCAAARGEEAGRRFPVPPPTRAMGSEVTVQPSRGRARVRHEVQHACCLAASVESARGEGATLVLTERLTGTPCRCRCASTLTTTVPLPMGEWTIVLDLDTNGSVRRVGTYQATVE